MLVNIENATLQSVWEESFENTRKEKVVFYRGLLNVENEGPVQCSVLRADLDEMSALVGVSGTATFELAARPGDRVKLYLKGIG